MVKETSTSSLKKLKVEPASKRDATVGDGEEEDPLDYYYKVKAMKERKKVAKLVRSAPDIGECEEQDEVTDGKRAINYQVRVRLCSGGVVCMWVCIVYVCMWGMYCVCFNKG